MSIIPELQRKRQAFVNRSLENKQQIQNFERSYESLRNFKGTVERSQDDFHSVNSKKSEILAEVEDVMKNSKTAQRYDAGMKNVFTGVGSKIVGYAYSVFLANISARLRKYEREINTCDNDIAYCSRKINEIDRDISAAMAAEEAEKAAADAERLANAAAGGR